MRLVQKLHQIKLLQKLINAAKNVYVLNAKMETITSSSSYGFKEIKS